MSLFRRIGAQVALLVLSLLGVIDAIYLTLVHYNSQVPLACSDSGFINCSRVITSPYAYVPGTSLPISLPGMGWCAVLAVLAILGLWQGDERRWFRIAQFVWTLLGMLTVFYLVYIEVVVLRNLCAWCTVLHVLILLMFFIAVVRLPGRFTTDEEEWEEDEEVEASEPLSTAIERKSSL